MPSIAEATRVNEASRAQRFLGGVGFVVVGALLVGLGAAGLTSGIPVRAGLLTGGVLVLSTLGALALRTSLRDDERHLLAVGVGLGLASLLFLWAAAPAEISSISASTALGALGYLAGLTVVVAAMLARVTLATGHSTGLDRSDSIAWRRSESDGSRHDTAADGGTRDDDDLTFPLEDE